MWPNTEWCRCGQIQSGVGVAKFHLLHFSLLCYPSNMQKPNSCKMADLNNVYCIRDIENDLAVIASSDPQLVCSSDKTFQQYWYKKFPDGANDECVLIITAAISCTTEGESRDRGDYLWKQG